MKLQLSGLFFLFANVEKLFGVTECFQPDGKTLYKSPLEIAWDCLATVKEFGAVRRVLAL